MMARQLGGGRHGTRSGVEDMTQGEWAADGMTEGGGQTTHACWWLTVSGGGGRGCTQDVLKIVPHNCTSNCAKLPQKIGFSEEILARFEVQFDVQQIVPQIIPVFCVTEQALEGTSLLSTLFGALCTHSLADFLLFVSGHAPRCVWVLQYLSFSFAW
jgi:hypothetical protein